jgi:hypothetical protein
MHDPLGQANQPSFSVNRLGPLRAVVYEYYPPSVANWTDCLCPMLNDRVIRFNMQIVSGVYSYFRSGKC